MGAFPRTLLAAGILAAATPACAQRIEAGPSAGGPSFNGAPAGAGMGAAIPGLQSGAGALSQVPGLSLAPLTPSALLPAPSLGGQDRSGVPAPALALPAAAAQGRALALPASTLPGPSAVSAAVSPAPGPAAADPGAPPSAPEARPAAGAGQAASGGGLPELIRRLSSSRGGDIPVLDQRTAQLLSDVPADQRVTVRFSGLFDGGREREMTAEEALAEAVRAGASGLRVERIHAGARSRLEPSVSAKFEDGWLSRLDPEEDGLPHPVTVEFASGELARFTGSREMLLRLAAQPDVRQVRYGEGPAWIRSVKDVPSAHRAQGYDPLADLSRRIPASSRLNAKSAGIAGMTVHHGTLDVFEKSVRSGPRNIGKGFGGRGLYAAVDGQRDLAGFFARWAADEASSRVRHSAEAVDDSMKGGRPKAVVLQGRVSSSRPLRVGRFTIVREEWKMDLARGILPANWDDDPRLRALLEREFDVLDLRGMRSGGLAIDTDRMLVFHEAAGPGAVVWGPSAAP